jgi:hypothetical protein
MAVGIAGFATSPTRSRVRRGKTWEISLPPRPSRFESLPF